MWMILLRYAVFKKIISAIGSAALVLVLMCHNLAVSAVPPMSSLPSAFLRFDPYRAPKAFHRLRESPLDDHFSNLQFIETTTFENSRRNYLLTAPSPFGTKLKAPNVLVLFRKFWSRIVLAVIIVLSCTIPCLPSAASIQTEHTIRNPSPLSSLLISKFSDSVVFDTMDECPEIEPAIMNGSKTTIVPLRLIPPSECGMRSQFGDLLEIEYVAKKLGPPVRVYDASIWRGTGSEPFKFVLGSGVLVSGVDMGLYDMCPGEVRLLKIPPRLAIGLLDPPEKAPLEWSIELVSIDGVIKWGNNDGTTLRQEQY